MRPMIRTANNGHQETTKNATDGDASHCMDLQRSKTITARDPYRKVSHIYKIFRLALETKIEIDTKKYA